MKKQSNRAKQRELKYHIVLRDTYDRKLAAQARDWSWKRITETYGLTEVNQVLKIKLKSVKEREKLRREAKLRQLEFRRRQWSRFSQADGMPERIAKQAAQINASKGYDPMSNYGYAVIYYSFTEEKSIEETKKMIWVDKFDGNNYRQVTRITNK